MMMACFGFFLFCFAMLAPQSMCLELFPVSTTNLPGCEKGVFADGQVFALGGDDGDEVHSFDVQWPYTAFPRYSEGWLKTPTAKKGRTAAPAGHRFYDIDAHPDLRLLAVTSQPIAQTPDSRALLSFMDMDTGLFFARTVDVCQSGPGCVRFSPDGRRLVVACEGEPYDLANGTRVDPVGSVVVVDLGSDAPILALSRNNDSAVTATPVPWPSRDRLVDAGAHLLPGRGRSLDQELEPEFVAMASGPSGRAYVSLQEANVILELDLVSIEFRRVLPGGLSDHRPEAADHHFVDVSDRDQRINLAQFPHLFSMRTPDSMAVFETNAGAYLLLVNEGDSKPEDERRVADLTLDPTVFEPPLNGSLLSEQSMGRLVVSLAQSDVDGDGQCERLVCFGSRSISIVSLATHEQVYDSTDAIARTIVQYDPSTFNADGDEEQKDFVDSFDSRSDKQGSEPDCLAIGHVDGRVIAFVGLERTGGIVMFDVTEPATSAVIGYFRWPVDRRCEVLQFVQANELGSGAGPALIAFNEGSETLSVYGVRTEPTRERAAPPVSLPGSRIESDLLRVNALLGWPLPRPSLCETTDAPSPAPTNRPPTVAPTVWPTGAPTNVPTGAPSPFPTSWPTYHSQSEPPAPSSEPATGDFVDQGAAGRANFLAITFLVAFLLLWVGTLFILCWCYQSKQDALALLANNQQLSVLRQQQPRRRRRRRRPPLP